MAPAALRRATPDDAEAIARMSELLRRDGAAVDPRYDVRPSSDEWVRRLQAQLSDGALLAFVADDGGPVGYVLAHPASARVVAVVEVYVTPPYRRAGLGRALVDRVVQAARASGRPEVAVGTLALDRRAVAFWSAMGFEAYWLTLRRR